MDAPPPLSKEEFLRRYNSGLRTFEEIDPEFHKWNKHQDRIYRIKLFFLFAVIMAGILFSLFLMISDVVRTY